MDVSLKNEDLKLVKVRIQLTKDELTSYKSLIMVYMDVFAWSYKDLKSIPLEVAQHRIPLLPN